MSITWIGGSSSVASQSIENNTSKVNVSVSLSWNYGSYAEDGPYWYINVYKDGTKVGGGEGYVNFNTARASNGTASNLFSVNNITIEHNSDGSSGIITWDAGYEGNYKDEGVWFTCSGTITVDTIPRATTPTLSATSVNINTSGSSTNSVTISMQPASSSFSHKIYYTIGSKVNQLIGTTSAAASQSKSWAPPFELADEISTTTSGTCTIKVETYSSNTQNSTTLIGSKTVSLTLVVPDTSTFNISNTSITWVENSSNVKNSGLKTDNFYTTKSSLKITNSATPGRGAYIKSYQTTVVYTGSGQANDTSASQTFNGKIIPANTTSITITTIFTDSRNRTSTKTATISNILSYGLDSLNALSRTSYSSLTYSGYTGTVPYSAQSTWTASVASGAKANYKFTWYVRYGNLSGTSGLTPTIYSQPIQTSNSFTSSSTLTNFNILSLGLTTNIYYQLGVKINNGLDESDYYWLNGTSISTATSNITLNGNNSLCVLGAQTPTTYNQHDNGNVTGATTTHFYDKIRAVFTEDSLITGVNSAYYINNGNRINLSFSGTLSSGAGNVDLTFSNPALMSDGVEYTITIVLNTSYSGYTKSISFTKTQSSSIGVTQFSFSTNLINFYQYTNLKMSINASALGSNSSNDKDVDFNRDTGFKVYINGVEEIPSSIISFEQMQSEHILQYAVASNVDFYDINTNPLNLNLNGKNTLIVTLEAKNLFGKIVGTGSFNITLDFSITPTASFRNSSGYVYFENINDNDNTQHNLKSSDTTGFGIVDYVREKMDLYFRVTYNSFNNKTHSVKIQIAREDAATSTHTNWVDFYSDNIFSQELPISYSRNSVSTETTIGPITVREITASKYCYFRIVIDNDLTNASTAIGPYRSLQHTSANLSIKDAYYTAASGGNTDHLTINFKYPSNTLGYDFNTVNVSGVTLDSTVNLLYDTNSGLTPSSEKETDTIDTLTQYNKFIYIAPDPEQSIVGNPSVEYSDIFSGFGWTNLFLAWYSITSISITYGSYTLLTTHYQITNTALIYNAVPTIAYRPNYLAINENGNNNENDVLIIHSYNDYNRINLAGANHNSLINLSDGDMVGFIIDGGDLDEI